MDQPYSSQLFSPTHAANQTPQAPQCCLDTHQEKDYILCATCYKRDPKPVVDDDWDEESKVPKKPQHPISHRLS